MCGKVEPLRIPVCVKVEHCKKKCGNEEHLRRMVKINVVKKIIWEDKWLSVVSEKICGKVEHGKKKQCNVEHLRKYVVKWSMEKRNVVK